MMHYIQPQFVLW